MALCCYKGDNYHLIRTRNNTETFLRCAHILLNYFRSCLALPPLAASQEEWRQLENRLRQGLLAASLGRSGCHGIWQQLFTELDFCYDSKELLKSLLAKADDSVGADSMDAVADRLRDPAATDLITTKLSVINDDFYYFNLAARDVRNMCAGEDVPNALSPEQERQCDAYFQTLRIARSRADAPKAAPLPQDAPDPELSFVARPLPLQAACPDTSAR